MRREDVDLVADLAPVELVAGLLHDVAVALAAHHDADERRGQLDALQQGLDFGAGLFHQSSSRVGGDGVDRGRSTRRERG